MNPYQYQQAQIAQQQLQYQYPPGYIQPQVFQYNYGHGLGQAAAEPQGATGGQSVFAYGQQFAGNVAPYQAQAIPQQGAQVAYMQQGTIAQAQANSELYQQGQHAQAYAVQTAPANVYGQPLAQSQDQTVLQQQALLAVQMQQQQQQQATQPPLPEETPQVAAPPLPLEPAAPPPTSGASTGKLQQLIEQQKQYQEQLQQWQQQYAQWQAQHQHHPDQKQFHEWQQKMQQWRVQQEQLLEKQQKLVDDQIAAENQTQSEQHLQVQQQQLLQQQLQHQQVQQQQQQLLEQQKLQQQQELLQQQQQQQQQQQFHSQQQQAHQYQLQNQQQTQNQQHLQRPAAPNQMRSQHQSLLDSERLQRWQQQKSLQQQNERNIQGKEDGSAQTGQNSSWLHSQQHKQALLPTPVDEEGEGEELPSWLLQEPEAQDISEQNQYDWKENLRQHDHTRQNETVFNQTWGQKQDSSQRWQDQTRQQTNQGIMRGPPGHVLHGQNRHQQDQLQQRNQGNINWQNEGQQRGDNNRGGDMQWQQEKLKWLQENTAITQQDQNQHERQGIQQQQLPNWLQGQKSQASQLSSQQFGEQHSQQVPMWLQNQKSESQQQQQSSKWRWSNAEQSQRGESKQEEVRHQTQHRPTWLRSDAEQSQRGESNQEEARQQHLPKWLQSNVEQSQRGENKLEEARQTPQPPKWLQSNAEQSQRGESKPEEARQQTPQLPKWLRINAEQSQRGESKSEEARQQTRQPPKWLQSNAEQSQRGESKLEEARQQTRQPPNWMQSGSGLSKDSGIQQTEPQQLPKWLQNKCSQPQMNKNQQVDLNPSNSQQEQRHSGNLQQPKWLQGRSTSQQQNSSKTEAEEGQQEQAKKELPKWMQQTGKAEETQSLPKWLQGKSLGDQEPRGVANQQKNQPIVSSAAVPSNIASNAPAMDSEQQRMYQQHLEHLKKSSLQPSQDGKPPMEKSAAKLTKIQEELEVLRKQQEQLQQLREIERKMKQGSTNSPVTTSVSTSSSAQSTMTNSASYNEPDKQAEQKKSNISKYKKAPCKFFPSCRNGKACRFWHPPCQYLERCRKPDCPYDHEPPHPPLAHLPTSLEQSSRNLPASRFASDITGSYNVRRLQDQDDLRWPYDADSQPVPNTSQLSYDSQSSNAGEEAIKERLENQQEPVRTEVRHQILRLSSHDEKIPGIGDNEYPAAKPMEENKEEDIEPSAAANEMEEKVLEVPQPEPGSEEVSRPGEEKQTPQGQYFGEKPDSRDEYLRQPFGDGDQYDRHFQDDRLRHERGRDRYSPPPGHSDWDRSRQREGVWPYPRDRRDRSPLHRDERDSRPPIPRDSDRLPLQREYRDRSPPLRRDDRAYPPADRPGRDEWDRPPFGREWDRFPLRDRPPPPDGWDHRPAPNDGPHDSLPPPRDQWDRPPYPRDYRERSPPFDRRRGWSPPPHGFHDRDIPPHIPPDQFDRFDRPPLPPNDEFDRCWHREDWPVVDPNRERDLYHDRDERPPLRDWDRRDMEYERERDDIRRSRSPPRWGRDHDEDRYRGEHARGELDPWRDRERERDYPPLDRRDYDRNMDLNRQRQHYPEPRGLPGDYRDERGPPSDPYYDRQGPPPHPRDSRPPNRPPPVEKVIEVVPVESILEVPGRDSRPDNIVIILRGPPGSGKTHVAKLIKDKEILNGGHAPRILAIDDYFLTEVEKYEKDPETGRRVKRKVTEYVYEEEMEEIYRASLFKAFMRTLDDGFFPVIIVDAIHDKVRYFEKYWSQAKEKGFQVYVAEVMADAHACAKRNSHNRTFEEINKMVNEWEEAPAHMLRLDTRSLLQDAVITEVEMEMADEPGTSEMSADQATEVKDEERIARLPMKSRWEMDETTEDRLNKLDGIRPLRKRTREDSPPMIPDDDDPYDEREEDMRIGKKRVRWADLEDKKHLEHRRKIGFCIGTDWSLFTDPNAEIPH